VPDTRNGEVRVPEDADLALPRPPGIVRRFWARHPLFADILLALLCLALALAGASGGALSAGPLVSVAIVVLIGATCTAMLFRRRVPLLAFILAVTLLLTSTVTPHGAAGAPLVLSVYALAVYGSARLALRAGVIGTAVVCTVVALVAVFAHPATMLPTTVNVFFNTALPCRSVPSSASTSATASAISKPSWTAPVSSPSNAINRRSWPPPRSAHASPARCTTSCRTRSP
jgi:hypothetical protein